MEYKFRHPLTDVNGNFKEWFYWGFIDDTFITPATQLNGYDTRNKSQMYTGRKDKNGVEIYSGDYLVLNNECVVIVLYNTQTACYEVEYDSGERESLYAVIDRGAECSANTPTLNF